MSARISIVLRRVVFELRGRSRLAVWPCARAMRRPKRRRPPAAAEKADADKKADAKQADAKPRAGQEPSQPDGEGKSCRGDRDSERSRQARAETSNKDPPRAVHREGRAARIVRANRARSANCSSTCAKSIVADRQGGRRQVDRRRGPRHSQSGRSAAAKSTSCATRSSGSAPRARRCYAQIESAMPADYLVACACDEIVMPESGIIVLPGIHAEATFYKGLLDKLGIRGRLLAHGRLQGRRRAAHAREIQRAGPREHDGARSTACTTTW